MDCVQGSFSRGASSPLSRVLQTLGQWERFFPPFPPTLQRTLCFRPESFLLPVRMTTLTKNCGLWDSRVLDTHSRSPRARQSEASLPDLEFRGTRWVTCLGGPMAPGHPAHTCECDGRVPGVTLVPAVSCSECQVDLQKRSCSLSRHPAS